MAATPLASPVEFTALKNLSVSIVPTMADYTNPTRTELNAGTDVTRHITKTGITGFTKTANTVQADNLKTGGSVSLDDGYSLDQSSIQFLMSKSGTTTDVRSVLTEGSSYYLVFFDTNDTPGKKMDIWPVMLQTLSKTKQAGAPMLITAMFQVNTPAENVTVPA